MTNPDLAERYQKLVDYVRPFEGCWNQSVLHFWPACRDALPDEWWQSLTSWPLASLHALDQALALDALLPEAALPPTGLYHFLESVRPYLDFPRAPKMEALSKKGAQRMTIKKQHELACLLPFLKQELQQLDIKRAVDIGGGVGHLARTVTTQLQLPVVSIDRDAALQSMGHSYLKSLSEPHALSFVQAELSPEPQSLDPYFEGSCLSLGLHTCGPLAWTHLKKSQTSRALLNFGCCYDRLDPMLDCQQSLASRLYPLPMTSFALFLATRGRYRTEAELAFQERVNSYRLGLHLFMQAEHLTTGFVSVGDAPRSLYLRSFEDYVEDRFRSLQLEVPRCRERAAAFVKEEFVQRSMREFFIINVVRHAFARPLETLLILDRALWLEEQGHEVELRQFFDFRISPRNLGIFARIKNSSPRSREVSHDCI